MVDDKMKKKILVIISLIVVALTITAFSFKNLNNSKLPEKYDKNMFALMLEETGTNGNGTGTYLESDSDRWPTGKYMFNAALSHCEDLESIELSDVLKYSNREKTAYVTSETMTFCWLYFKIDNTAPVITEFYMGNDKDKPYTNTRNVEGHITFTDDFYEAEMIEGGDADSYCIKKNNNSNNCSWVSLTEDEIKNKHIDFDIQLDNTEGSQTRYVFIKDIAGNISGVSSYTITFDKTAPTVDITVANGNVYAKSKTATFKISDNERLKSGSYTIYYKWSTSAITCANLTSANGASTTSINVSGDVKEATTTITVDGQTGSGKIYACIKEKIYDYSENYLAANQLVNANMYLDNTGPTINVVVADGATYSKSKTATITIGDANSGLAAGTYTIKYAWGTSAIACTSSSMTTTTITASSGDSSKSKDITINGKTGAGKIYVCNSGAINDVAGNSLSNNTRKSADMYLDNTGPDLTVTNKIGTNTYNGSWTKESVKSYLTFSDDNSGIDISSIAWYTTDNNKYTKVKNNTSTSSYTSTDWSNEINDTNAKWKVCDLAENCTERSFTIKIDKSAPSLVVNNTVNNKTYSGEFTKGPVKTLLTMTDTMSPINTDTIQWKVEGGTYAKTCNNAGNNLTSITNGYTCNNSWASDYNTKAYYKVCNAVGLCDEKSFNIAIDNTPPSCSITGNPTSWQNTNATLTGSSADSGSGSVKYKWDSGSYGTTTTLTVSANGKHTLYVKDSLENEKSCEADVTKIDKTAPVIVLTHTGTALSGTITDNESGLAGYKIKTTSGNPSSFDTASGKTMNIPSTSHTSGTLYVYAKNNAGSITHESVGYDSGYVKKGATKDIFTETRDTKPSCASTNTKIATCAVGGSKGAWKISVTGVATGTAYIKWIYGGNVVKIYAVTVLNAPTKPTITASDSKASGSWHTANTTLSFSGSSLPGNGQINYYYGTSSSSITTKANSVEIKSETKTTTYYVKACNSLETSFCSDVASYELKLDKTAPTKSPTMSFVFGDWSAYGGTWTTSAIYAARVKGSPGPTGSEDNISGVAKYQISTDGASWTDYAYDYTKDLYKMSSSATHVRYFRACNGAGLCGNASVTTKVYAYIDKDGPSLTVSNTAGGKAYTGGWTNQSVISAITATETGAPVDKTTFQWKVAGGNYANVSACSNPTAVTGGFTCTDTWAGERNNATGYYRVCNTLGLCTEKSFTLNIDKTPPTITFGISGTSTATIHCSETNKSDSKTDWTQALTGTSNVTVSKTCVDLAGNSTTNSHTYIYDSCISGSNTCAYGCDTEYSSCATGENTCQDSTVTASSESAYICDAVNAYSDTCSGGTSAYTLAESKCREGTYWNGVVTRSGKKRYATCKYCAVGFNYRASYGDCIKYCATGHNTCQPGYVNKPGTCKDCYTGSNTCTGGFKF